MWYIAHFSAVSRHKNMVHMAPIRAHIQYTHKMLQYREDLYAYHGNIKCWLESISAIGGHCPLPAGFAPDPTIMYYNTLHMYNIGQLRYKQEFQNSVLVLLTLQIRRLYCKHNGLYMALQVFLSIPIFSDKILSSTLMQTLRIYKN